MVIEDEFVELSGIRLFTRKLIPEGHWNNKKPVVIFLHEGLGSVNQWKDFPGKFIEECSLPVLLYNRQGYGRSSPLTEKRGPVCTGKKRYICFKSMRPSSSF
jgi:pimeloyl-ACP methyl ester carboxylesterase